MTQPSQARQLLQEGLRHRLEIPLATTGNAESFATTLTEWAAVRAGTIQLRKEQIAASHNDGWNATRTGSCALKQKNAPGNFLTRSRHQEEIMQQNGVGYLERELPPNLNTWHHRHIGAKRPYPRVCGGAEETSSKTFPICTINKLCAVSNSETTFDKTETNTSRPYKLRARKQ